MILPHSLLNHARRGVSGSGVALFSVKGGGASLRTDALQQTAKNEWLVWSPGVPARIAASYVFVAVALAVLARSPAQHAVERAAVATRRLLLLTKFAFAGAASFRHARAPFRGPFDYTCPTRSRALALR